MITPSTTKDFKLAQSLAFSGQVSAVVIVNAFAKVGDPNGIDFTER